MKQFLLRERLGQRNIDSPEISTLPNIVKCDSLTLSMILLRVSIGRNDQPYFFETRLDYNFKVLYL